MLSVYPQAVHAHVLDHLSMLNCINFFIIQMNGRVFWCQDTNKLIFYRKWRLLIFKISDVNNSISIFKFGVINRVETLSC